MLAIKFQRVGKKHQPSYRIVVAEKRSKLGGPPVEQVGFYSPLTKEININAERAKYWLGVGALPTTSVHNLFVKQGVISGPKIAVKIKKREAADEPAGQVAQPLADDVKEQQLQEKPAAQEEQESSPAESAVATEKEAEVSAEEPPPAQQTGA